MSKFQEVKTSFTRNLFDDVKARVLKLANADKQPPWMKSKELDIIKSVLINTSPQNCLEWGAGYSSLYFPNLLSGTFSWTSIEHNESWAAKIANKNTLEGVNIKFIPPNSTSNSDSYNDGSYEDFEDYLEASEPGSKYDFILIDGRARSECLKKVTFFNF